jgi:hypothetical protein
MPDVPVGIIDTILHPPIGVLIPRLDYHGPYEGNVTVTEFSTTPGPIFTDIDVRASYGVVVQLNGAIPAGFGFTNGWVSDDTLYDEAIYDVRLLQLVVQHQFSGGAWVSTQVENIYSFPKVILWTEALPGRVGLLVAPGLAFDLLFLGVQP